MGWLRWALRRARRAWLRALARFPFDDPCDPHDHRPPPRPRAPRLASTEEFMGLKAFIDLPAPLARDMAKRELHVTIGADPETVTELAADAVSAAVACERGASVSLFLVDVDTSGNRSPSSPVLTFVAVDGTPPPAPAAPTLNRVEEDDVV